MRIHPMAYLIGGFAVWFYLPVAWRLAGLHELPAPKTWAWYTVALDFQSGIGALSGSLFGLIAILLGARWAYKNSKKLEKERIEDESRAIAGALAGEIYEISESFLFQSNYMKDVYKASIPDSLDLCEDPPLFNKIGGRIGILPNPLPRLVTRYYAAARRDKTTLDTANKVGKTEGVNLSSIDSLAIWGAGLRRKAESGVALTEALEHYAATGIIPCLKHLNHRSPDLESMMNPTSEESPASTASASD